MAFNLQIISGFFLPLTSPFQIPSYPAQHPLNAYTHQPEGNNTFKKKTKKKTGKIFWTLMFGWVFKFSKALQDFLSRNGLPLLNIKEGPVLYEMKYLVIPKAMNPSRNVHCKTEQIMRNTFLFLPSTKREEKRRCGLYSEQLGCWKGIVCQNTGQKEWAKASSFPLWSELPGRVDGWRGFASSKRFTDRSLRDAVHTATEGGEIARQTIKS